MLHPEVKDLILLGFILLFLLGFLIALVFSFRNTRSAIGLLRENMRTTLLPPHRVTLRETDPMVISRLNHEALKQTTVRFASLGFVERFNGTVPEYPLENFIRLMLNGQQMIVLEILFLPQFESAPAITLTTYLSDGRRLTSTSLRLRSGKSAFGRDPYNFFYRNLSVEEIFEKHKKSVSRFIERGASVIPVEDAPYMEVLLSRFRGSDMIAHVMRK